jgi:uncharacterized repeat protein (TIGR01451 family)
MWTTRTAWTRSAATGTRCVARQPRRTLGALGALGTLSAAAVLGAIVFAGPAGAIGAADPNGPGVGSPTSGSAGRPAITVTISDASPAASPGERLTYQSVVTNNSSSDAQLLLEITVPDGAKVVDAGGGTTRPSVIDYGLTVLSHHQVSEQFAVVLGAGPSSKAGAAAVTRVSARASVFLLGGASSTGGTTPDFQAVDSDVVNAAGAGVDNSADSAARPGASVRAAGATSSGHHGWWIAALILGVALIIGGLVIASGKGFADLRRAGRIDRRHGPDPRRSEVDQPVRVLVPVRRNPSVPVGAEAGLRATGTRVARNDRTARPNRSASHARGGSR